MVYYQSSCLVIVSWSFDQIIIFYDYLFFGEIWPILSLGRPSLDRVNLMKYTLCNWYFAAAQRNKDLLTDLLVMGIIMAIFYKFHQLFFKKDFPSDDATLATIVLFYFE